MVKALEKLTEYPLYWKDLDTIPEDQKALLSLVSFASSECNALGRLYLFASHELTGNEAIDSGMNVQRFVLLRAWSAKLFELNETIEKLAMGKGTSDEVVVRLCKLAREKFHEMDMEEGFKVARIFRNESTSHYSFEAAKKNLRHVSEAANVKMFLHEKEGNSFYPMGEEVMFTARMNRLTSSFRTIEQKNEKLRVWLDWNMKASEWARNFHARVGKDLVFDRFPSRYAQEKVYWIDSELVGQLKGRRTPVFLRIEKAS